MDLDPHINPAALAHVIERLVTASADVTKSSISVAAGMRPGNLREYETGIRLGSTDDIRARLASATGVRPQVITCYCDRPETQVGVDASGDPRLERRCRNWLADL